VLSACSTPLLVQSPLSKSEENVISELKIPSIPPSLKIPCTEIEEFPSTDFKETVEHILNMIGQHKKCIAKNGTLIKAVEDRGL
jgi:hypothetical protein